MKNRNVIYEKKSAMTRHKKRTTPTCVPCDEVTISSFHKAHQRFDIIGPIDMALKALEAVYPLEDCWVYYESDDGTLVSPYPNLKCPCGLALKEFKKMVLATKSKYIVITGRLEGG